MPLSWLPLGLIRASASSRAAALQSAKLEDLPLPPVGAVTWLAGGKQSKGALPVKTPAFDAAVYSSRGRGYARYNEDAALLFVDGRGHLYLAVLDQAGGLGGRVRGAASELAALRLFETWKRLATASETSPEHDSQAMLEAMERAHTELVQRREGEVTTAVAAVARPGAVVLVNSGDSGALQFARSGAVRATTVMHEHISPLAAGCLTHGIGLIPEAAAPDTYHWVLERGDWLLLATDGLLDSTLSPAEIGEIIAGSDTAEAAVNKLCTRVLRMMAILRAKPDNLSIAAVRVL